MSHRRRAPGPMRLLGEEKGLSLIVVLWVMALLMVIVTEFAYSMRVEGSSALNFKDEAAARSLAEAGVNLGLSEVMEDYEAVGVDADGKLIFYSKDAGVLVPREVKREIPLGKGRVVYAIEDENGKLSLNKAPREQLVELLKRAGVEAAERDIIADSILDWRDSNREFHLNGAESDYYESLERPYSARDADFETAEELLLVKGVTREIFYGPKDPARSPFRSPEADAPDVGYKGISGLVTAAGDGRVNPNTAPYEVLAAVFGTAKADEIMGKRAAVGTGDFAQPGASTRSTAFTIVSRGEVDGIRVGIRAVVEKRAAAAGAVVQPGQAKPNQFYISYWKEEGTVAE